jgi:hypothetical protein
VNLRDPANRRRAAIEIDKLARAHPGLIAFPLRKVGYVEGVTPCHAAGAVVFDLAAFSPVRRSAVAPTPMQPAAIGPRDGQRRRA